jgi:hypothetical protein
VFISAQQTEKDECLCRLLAYGIFRTTNCSGQVRSLDAAIVRRCSDPIRENEMVIYATMLGVSRSYAQEVALSSGKRDGRTRVVIESMEEKAAYISALNRPRLPAGLVGLCGARLGQIWCRSCYI